MKLFGYHQEAAVGSELAELIVPPDLRAAHRAGLQRYLSTGLGRIVEQRTEVPAVDRSGRIFPAELALWPVSDGPDPWFAAMVRDVTDLVAQREASEAANRQARAAQRQLTMMLMLMHAPIGMALVSVTGRWLVVNPSLTRLLGYSESELLALSFQEITHPDDLDLDLAHVRRLLDGEISDYTLDKRYRRRDGGTIWVSLSVSLVRDDDGQPVHFISQIQDISDRQARLHELQRRALTDRLTRLVDRAVLAREAAGGGRAAVRAAPRELHRQPQRPGQGAAVD
jgi:two-component system sensor histidine kinase UhpB